MFRWLVLFLIMTVLLGCTNSQFDAFLDYAAREQCAEKYMKERGTGIQNAYLHGMHECRYADVDARKAKERARERALRPETEGERVQRELAGQVGL